MISEQTPFRGSVLAVATGIAGKILGFAGTLMIATLLGATAETDLVFFSYNMILITVSFFICFNNNALVPRLIALREKGKEQQGLGLILGVLVVCLIPLCAIFLLGWNYSSELLSFISRFQPGFLQSSPLFIQLLLPLLILIYLNDLWVNLFQAYRNFSFTYAVSIAQGLGLVLCVGLLYRSMGAASISLGFLLAHLLVLLLLLWFLRPLLKKMLRSGIEFTEFREFFSMILPVLSLQVSQLFLLFLPDYLASGMEQGTLSAILNARKIFDLLPTLLIYPIVAVGYTRLCSLAASKKGEDFTSLCLSLNFFLISLVFPLSIYLCVYAKPFVSLLFGYGKYSAEALLISTDSLRWFALGAFALVTHSLAGRALVATQRKTALYAYASALALGAVVYAALLIFLSKDMGYLGIPMGTALYQIMFLSPMSYFLLYKFTGAFSILRVLYRLGGLVFLSAPAIILPVLLLPPDGQKPWVLIPVSLFSMLFLLTLTHVGLKTESYRFIRDRLDVLHLRRNDMSH